MPLNVRITPELDRRSYCTKGHYHLDDRGATIRHAYGLSILLASGKGRHRFLRNDGGPIENRNQRRHASVRDGLLPPLPPAVRHAQRVDTSTSQQNACQPTKWVMTVKS